VPSGDPGHGFQESSGGSSEPSDGQRLGTVVKLFDHAACTAGLDPDVRKILACLMDEVIGRLLANMDDGEADVRTEYREQHSDASLGFEEREDR